MSKTPDTGSAQPGSRVRLAFGVAAAAALGVVVMLVMPTCSPTGR